MGSLIIAIVFFTFDSVVRATIILGCYCRKGGNLENKSGTMGTDLKNLMKSWKDGAFSIFTITALFGCAGYRWALTGECKVSSCQEQL